MREIKDPAQAARIYFGLQALSAKDLSFHPCHNAAWNLDVLDFIGKRYQSDLNAEFKKANGSTIEDWNAADAVVSEKWEELPKDESIWLKTIDLRAEKDKFNPAMFKPLLPILIAPKEEQEEETP